MEMTEGRLVFKGWDLNGLSEKEWRSIRGKEMGMVFQEPFTSLNPVIAVGRQLEETLKVHLGLAKEGLHKKVMALLSEVGLPDPQRIMRQYPHQLSGGMCQRVMLAMAIACSPSLLIADEPTTALDVTVQTQVLELLFRMTEQYRLAILFITHDLRIVRGYADRVAILYLGKVVEEGAPVEIFDHPQHPYTEGLLASMPEFSHKGKELFSIPGVVPSPFETIMGCAFADRCARVEARCRNENPEPRELTKGHQVRCFYPSKK
jgi:peptide/nickel transport system ATP-binding protein